MQKKQCLEDFLQRALRTGSNYYLQSYNPALLNQYSLWADVAVHCAHPTHLSQILTFRTKQPF